MLNKFRKISAPTLELFNRMEGDKDFVVCPGKWYYQTACGGFGIVEFFMNGTHQLTEIPDVKTGYNGVGFIPVFYPSYNYANDFEAGETYEVAKFVEETRSDGNIYPRIVSIDTDVSGENGGIADEWTIQAKHIEGVLVSVNTDWEVENLEQLYKFCQLPQREQKFTLCPYCGAVHRNTDDAPTNAICSACGHYFLKVRGMRTGSVSASVVDSELSRAYPTPYMEYAFSNNGLVVKGVEVALLLSAISGDKDADLQGIDDIRGELIRFFE